MKKLPRSPIILFFLGVAVIVAGVAAYRQFFMAAQEQD